MYKILLVLGFLVAFYSQSQAQALPQRERASKIDEILKQRFDEVLPHIMQRSRIDMWVLITREYNEDPVLKTMLPATWLNARRRTILVFYKHPESLDVEKMAVARYNFGDNIKSVWNKEQQPDQWQALATLIEARDPEKIGLNFSEYYGLSDGISKTDYEGLLNVLPEKYKNRIVSAEPLAVGWLETRTDLEMEIFENLVATTHEVIAEAFSNNVITPGETTTEDVVWFLRQKVTDLGYETWFHPTVDIQRTDEELESHITAFSNTADGKIIQRGDLLHCDFGISYLRLNTDCQQHAYVLKENETEAPQFLVDALEKGNRVQDVFTANFETGKSGNEILLESLSKTKAEGLRPSIYTHPLGLYGHSAGPTIGMWDAQEGVPGSGDYLLYENTAYAIELNTTVHLSDWNKDIRIMLEEAGFWGAEGFRYINERQENLILID